MNVIKKWLRRYWKTSAVPRNWGRKLPSGFRVGQRVSMTAVAREMLGGPDHGTVVGGWKNRQHIIVVRDGRATRESYAAEFWV